MISENKGSLDLTECKRCGQCCYYTLDGERRKCKYLVRINNRTVCRIYSSRLGKIIDISKNGTVLVKCCMRKDDYRIFLGCPQNRKVVLTS